MPSSASQPKHKRVFDQLREGVLSGKFRPGEKLPSEAGLVTQFGVSRITVGRAVRDLQRAGLVERRPGSGTYVSARHDSGSAKGLSFGLVIPNLGQTEIFEPICQGMTTAAGSNTLLWGGSSNDASPGEDAIRQCRRFVDQRVNGVFFAPLERNPEADLVNREIVKILSKAEIPVVLLDRSYLPYPQRSAFDLVGIDNRLAGYIAAEHLLSLGCTDIAFWAHPLSATTIEPRIAGFREALIARDLPVTSSQILKADPEDHGSVRSALENRPEGFVCANDRTAGALMHTLLSLGLRIPQDVRMVGIDDVRYASLLPVPLTTVHQPCHDIGVTAMVAMLDRLARPDLAPRDILLGCELVVRRSCGQSQGIRPPIRR